MPTCSAACLLGAQGPPEDRDPLSGSEMSSLGKAPGGARKPSLSFREGCSSREQVWDPCVWGPF